jgi:ribosomal protein L7/L12
MSSQTLGILAIFAAVIYAVFYVIAARRVTAAHRRRQRYAQPLQPPRQDDLVAAGASEQVAALLAVGRKINAIKAYKDEMGVGLTVAKRAVDGFESQGRTSERARELLAVGSSEQVASLLAHGDIIGAIKAYREETGTGLYDAKTAVDGFVSRVRMRALLADGVSERVAGLVAHGDSIGAIKAYREQTGAGLREAKEYVDALRQRQ